jgi:hypothetical protein
VKGGVLVRQGYVSGLAWIPSRKPFLRLPGRDLTFGMLGTIYRVLPELVTSQALRATGHRRSGIGPAPGGGPDT